jgi:hypothetical protein
MDEELKKRIADYFYGHELVEFLQIPVEDIIDAFEDRILEAIDDVEEMMHVKQ